MLRSITRFSSIPRPGMVRPGPFSGNFGKRTYVAKTVLLGADSRAKMLAGANKLADAVGVTLGPKGRNVIIEKPFGPPQITKDGVTVAKAIEFEDKELNLGASLVKHVATKAGEVAGDGTTTASLLTRAIFREGCKAVAANLNPMDVRRGIMLAVDKVVEHLNANKRECKTTEAIQQVAALSANSDQEIGSLIAHAMKSVGNEGVITVQEGKGLDNEIEVLEGMQWDNGFVSRYFVTDLKTQKCNFDDCHVLIYDGKISSVGSIIPILEDLHASRGGKLLMIAENFEGEALSTLILNRLRGMNICAVKAPGFGDRRKAMLEDIAILTRGTVISEERGDKLEDAKLEELGRCGKIEVTNSSTIIIDGAGGKDAISERCQLLQEQIDQSTSTYEKEKLQERLGKLSGGVAVIKVGGASEVEVNERKDRIDDALCATRCAVQEGIVPGGGCALLYATDALKDLKLANFDQNQGVEIIKAALQQPIKQIAENAGVEGAIIVSKLLEKSNKSWGWDAQNDKFVDMFDAGIIDPTKVVRTALIDAATVASYMITAECMITEIPQPPAPPMGGAGGGMGGMGGGMF